MVGSLGVTTQQIANLILYFEANVLWTLARHRLFPTPKDNVLSSIHATIIAGLMVRYELDMG